MLGKKMKNLLRIGSDYVYPITTVDQIYMEDGKTPFNKLLDDIKRHMDTHNIRTYTDVSQFGCSYADTCRLILNSVPNKSIVMLNPARLGSDWNLPTTFGVLEIHKTVNGDRINSSNVRMKVILWGRTPANGDWTMQLDTAGTPQYKWDRIDKIAAE